MVPPHSAPKGMKGARYGHNPSEFSMKTRSPAAFVFTAMLTLSCASTTPPPSTKTGTQNIATARKAARAPVDGHQRLGYDVVPTGYALDVAIDPRKDTFEGVVKIDLTIKSATPEIRLHADGPTVTRAQLEHGSTMHLGRTQAGQHGGLAIRFPKPLAPGPATLHLTYVAPLPETPVGIYRVKSGDDWYVYTQFEPLEARRAFPSFDQPEFKTPFRTTMRVPKGMTALTNGPEKTREPSGEWVKFTFAETQPLPTYLVAFAVGPFDITEAPTVKGLPRIRTVATRGKGTMTEWANTITGKVLLALQDYFGEPYPYAKLDQVAVPNFAAGAMENVGLVTYRERLLLLGDGTKATPASKLWGTVVIAHELGHMWFGNKVTLAWWDELWLNEAFATWISYKITDQVAPELEALVNFQGRVGSTMSWDAQKASRAIRQPIRTGGDVYNAFDPITYSKGAAVLSMLESWLGEDTFKKGLRAYVKAHAHGVAKTPDLMAALEAASGKKVGEAVAMFLDQPGTPLVSVKLDCSTPSKPALELKQTRYRPAGSDAAIGKPWNIPMCVRYGRGTTVGRYCATFSGRSGRIQLPTDRCPDWVHPNDNERGYYRWQMEPQQLRELVTRHRRSLKLVERVALSNHLMALLETKAIDAGLVLDGLKALSAERHHLVVSSLLSPLKTLAKHVAPNQKKAFASQVVKRVLGGHIKRLGFATRPNSKASTFADNLLRPKVSRTYFELMGDAVGGLRKALAGVADSALKDMSKLAASMFTATIPLAGRHGGKAFQDRAKAALDKAPTPAHRVALVRALGAAEDPATLKSGLDLILDGTLRAQDVREMLRYGAPTAQASQTRWKWLQANYAKLVAFVGKKSARGLVWFGAGLCTADDRAAFDAFFKKPENAHTGVPRMAAIVSEMIGRCVTMGQTAGPALRAYLRGR